MTFYTLIFGCCAISLLVLILSYILYRKEYKLGLNIIWKATEYSLIVITTLGIIYLILLDINFLNYQKPIPHHDWESISLEDFKAFPRPEDQKYSARICSKITVNKDGDNFEVVAKFYPAQSWSKYDSPNLDRLLTHELYHFHLTELYARKLRKALLEKSPSIDWKYLKKLNTENLNQEQSRYDKQTSHGILLGEQLNWQNKIDSLLQQYEKYSDTNIYL
ncbi:hypothetical protein [Persicobacter diffluens]|uniref:DUF922 domain-containing protein n=1 Tax=Persicobacter diffluens TaxID=981 RepID=A0AAN5ALH8_9BACT|nr:hypothetical protein PEDI_38160 [Persicobacter diffluens]